ncbi:hypothetical protein KEM48_012096 [Puccinia striiformis f. sp. tritici PST-130]|nr:hypothetical protein KEM48_012096 [Puccinia striiformis f. sp. tritici PST-130]
MRGQGERRGDGTFDSLPVNVTLAHLYRFDILPGHSYVLGGKVTKLDDGRTTVMHVDNSIEHRALPGGEVVEPGPIMISGTGVIMRVRYTNTKHGNGDGRVKVRWLLAMGDMDIPYNTNFKLGTRIALAGRLEALGEPAGLVVVKVRPPFMNEL